MSASATLPLADVPRPLLAKLRSLPGTRADVYVLFQEDEYETAFGDGRFLYPCAAFLDERAATEDLERRRGEQEAARRMDPHTTGYRYSLKPIEVVRDEARNQLVADLQFDKDERLTLQDLVRLLKP